MKDIKIPETKRRIEGLAQSLAIVHGEAYKLRDARNTIRLFNKISKTRGEVSIRKLKELLI